MIKVKLHASWRVDHDLREVMSKQMKEKYRWNDLYFVDDGEDFDYLVIFNFPKRHKNFPKEKTIIFQGEPSFTRKKWGEFYKPNPDEYLKVFETNDYFNYPAWSINKTYQWLKENDINKDKRISCVVSNLTAHEEQRKRTNFIKDYLYNIKDFDHYGKGINFIQNKEDGLFPYKYTFQSENNIEMGYVTEKLYDSIVSECLCFYNGAPNVKDLVDERAFIKIDLNKPKEAYDIIINSMKNNEWESRIKYIHKEKDRIMNEFQIFPLVEKVIKNNI